MIPSRGPGPPYTMSDWLLIALGLAALIVSADLLVRGSVWIALTLGISKMVVGLTLVAFGTSAPELVVSLTAALRGAPGVATGNVLGSNIANLGLIVGIAALVKPIAHPPGSARFELRYMILTSALVMVPIALGTVARWHGVVLVLFLCFFTWKLIGRERTRRRNRVREDSATTPRPATSKWALNGMFVAVGFTGLIYGGGWLVDGATAVARSLGWSDVVIGMSIVAVGTSLPELATSIVAAKHGHPELALGNVLGSNIFNVCLVLGTTAAIHPLPVKIEVEGPPAVLGVLMAVALALLLRYRGGISRLAGSVLLLSYLAYMALAIAQN